MRFSFYFGIAAAVVSGMLMTSCSKEFDPSELEQQIQNLADRVSRLETAVSSANTSISSLETIVKALNSKLHVVSLDKTEQGTLVTFTDGSTALIPTSGAAGNAPVIGVKEDGGVYYWTIDGQYLKDKNGNRLRVTGKDGANGTNGVNGTNGKDGVTPVIGVKKDGDVYYWTVNGEYLLDSAGKKVPANYAATSGTASDSVFKSVTVKNGTVTFVLKDGQSFVIPMQAAANLRIEANKLHFKAGETQTIHIATENIIGTTITEKPDGWKASIEGCTIKVTAPKSADADKTGYLAVLATSGGQTFIGKVRLTLDSPLFSMSVNPTGVLTLTELDSDFNNPGFIAGFMKADEFDPATVLEKVKGYTPSTSEDYFTSWSSAQTGKKTFDVNIKESGITPVAGERYAAYCFPGYYIKGIGATPDPYDVEVVYFTYVTASVSATGVTTDKATVSASVSGASSFYGGISRIYPDTDMNQLKARFLEDAEGPFSGLGDGTMGVMMKSYNGALNMFAALDDGDGNKNPKSIVPGATYAIAIIPNDGERVIREYTTGDVIIEKLELAKPTQTSTALATVKAGASTTTTASSFFSITSSVSKFYYTLVKATEFKASGLTEYDYATRYGVIWDRAILKANGAIDNIDITLTSLKPGEECLAIGVAFTNSGQYYMTTLKVNASQVLTSDGTLSVSGVSLSSINANSTQVTFNYSASKNIKTVRYMTMTKANFASEYSSSDDKVYAVLTAGSRWDYEEVNAGDAITTYVYPEKVDYIFFAVGVDEAGKFTKLAKLSYQPVK